MLLEVFGSHGGVRGLAFELEEADGAVSRAGHEAVAVLGPGEVDDGLVEELGQHQVGAVLVRAPDGEREILRPQCKVREPVAAVLRLGAVSSRSGVAEDDGVEAGADDREHVAEELEDLPGASLEDRGDGVGAPQSRPAGADEQRAVGRPADPAEEVGVSHVRERLRQLRLHRPIRGLPHNDRFI